MHLLLTGSHGFVGKHFLQLQPAFALEDEKGEIELRDAERVERFIARTRPEAVVHLAAQSFVPRSFEDPKETLDINFFGTFNLLNALKKAGFKGRMLFVGSADQYGPVEESALPIREVQPMRPMNPYAVSKVAAEALCFQWSQHEFEILMARPFNHIGPGQSDKFVVSGFAKQMAAVMAGKQKSIQCGDRKVTRDFTDVRDVIRAYLALLRCGRSGETYNVCSGKERSIDEVLTTLMQLAGLQVPVIEESDRQRPSQQRRAVGSSAKLTSETGWTPQIEFTTSLKDTLDHWKGKDIG